MGRPVPQNMASELSDARRRALFRAAGDGDLHELKEALAAAVGGGDAGEAAQVAVVRAAVHEALGMTALHFICSRRMGGVGSSGWLAKLAHVLRSPLGEDPTFVNAVDAERRTALFSAVEGRKGTPKSEAQQLVATAVLLLHGADATLRDKTAYEERTPREAHTTKLSHNNPDVAALLERAEEVGGEDAVRELLEDSPSTLTRAPGWDVVADMPRVARAVAEAARASPTGKALRRRRAERAAAAEKHDTGSSDANSSTSAADGISPVKVLTVILAFLALLAAAAVNFSSSSGGAAH